MAYTTTTGGRASAGIARMIETITDALRERRAYRAIYRRTHGELSALSNRELADLGFARSEIGAIAHQAASGTLYRP